ncbi:MAG TPA: hypothetical protein DCS82_12155, partial [Rhodospirillaceae bacterium]|nr:hypothetical protein [Rhodospirillaceae bacterium]
MNTAHKDTEKSQHFYPDLQLIINGEYLSRDGAPVINPSTGESIADVPFATEADLASALEAAAQG